MDFKRYFKWTILSPKHCFLADVLRLEAFIIPLMALAFTSHELKRELFPDFTMIVDRFKIISITKNMSINTNTLQEHLHIFRR